jgi:hypothetical protein
VRNRGGKIFGASVALFGILIAAALTMRSNPVNAGDPTPDEVQRSATVILWQDGKKNEDFLLLWQKMVAQRHASDDAAWSALLKQIAADRELIEKALRGDETIKSFFFETNPELSRERFDNEKDSCQSLVVNYADCSVVVWIRYYNRRTDQPPALNAYVTQYELSREIDGDKLLAQLPYLNDFPPFYDGGTKDSSSRTLADTIYERFNLVGVRVANRETARRDLAVVLVLTQAREQRLEALKMKQKNGK